MSTLSSCPPPRINVIQFAFPVGGDTRVAYISQRTNISFYAFAIDLQTLDIYIYLNHKYHDQGYIPYHDAGKMVIKMIDRMVAQLVMAVTANLNRVG